MTTLFHVRPEPIEASWPDKRPLYGEAVEAACGRLIYLGGDLGPRGKRAMEAALREYLSVVAARAEVWRRDLEQARQRAQTHVAVSRRQR